MGNMENVEYTGYVRMRESRREKQDERKKQFYK